MTLKVPALHPRDVRPRTDSGYPEPYRSRVLPREKRALGDALGLTKIGINLTTLMPGKESSMRHWHTLEDELVYVLEGEVVLVTDSGEQVLGPGTCAGFAGRRARRPPAREPQRPPGRVPRDQQSRRGRHGGLPGRGPVMEPAGTPGPLYAAGRHAVLTGGAINDGLMNRWSSPINGLPGNWP